MTILELLLQTHLYMVKFFIFALVLIGALPNILRSNFVQMVFWSRIGYFLFWAAWTMVVFSGLLIFAVKRGELNIAVIAMIAAAILLALLDGYRAIKLKKFWLKEESGLKFSNFIVLIEFIIVVAVTILAIQYR